MLLNADDARRELVRRELEVRRCIVDPCFLVSWMRAPDERKGVQFVFDHVRDDVVAAASGWGWQRDFLLWLHGSHRVIALKARQLGVTWLTCAYAVWVLLYKRGSLSLVYRQKEEEAVENVIRCWRLFNTLPAHLRRGVEVVKPAKGAIPHGGEIVVRFPDGLTSRIVAMSSASASGHGKTAAYILLDEFSRVDRAGEILKAVQPAAGSAGKIAIISTANGRSNPDTGEGNQFHWLWTSAEEAGFDRRFMPWSLHPDRDQSWYDGDPEVRGLKPHERAEQYPANEHEAFSLTMRTFFGGDDLAYYAKCVKDPLYRGVFRGVLDGAEAVFDRSKDGWIRVLVEPKRGFLYAIGADVATGRGADYSVAYVVDLGSMELCVEFAGKLDADEFAEQLHFLGKWFNDALIAPEVAGGHGEAVVLALRDGRRSRPKYPRMYRHAHVSRLGAAPSKSFGYPTNTKTRPVIVNGMERVVRDRSLPWVTGDLLHEMESFVYREHGASPRAQDGSRDDRVMALGISLEMYRLYGDYSGRYKRRRRPVVASYPWQSRPDLDEDRLSARYPA